MRKRNEPLLSSLAASTNPLEDLKTVIAKLRRETKESRYAEWKLDPPLGPTVSVRAKYRTVKAMVSFANADGGFVVFGVDSGGKWIGLKREELALVDPAHILELINGCLFPDIQSVNFAEFEHQGQTFAVVHVPPSLAAPHVTTKDIIEKDQAGKIRHILNRYAVYYRQGAKSDIATPLQHQRIVNRRVERLRDDLVRRVREVTVPVGVGHLAPTGGGAASITVARLTKDPKAPAVRITRDQSSGAGILLHEELSDGLFEEINNVIDANALLNKGRGDARFLLGEPIWYRVYAERFYVQQSTERFTMLLKTGLVDMYAPYLYWALKAPAEQLAIHMKAVAAELRGLQVHSLVRLVTLLGQNASDWLWKLLHNRWRNDPQPPDYYWTFKEIRAREDQDRRFAALRLTARTSVSLADGTEVSVEKLLENGLEVSNQLTKACHEVFAGNKDMRTPARVLDVLAYGTEISTRSNAVEDELKRA